MKQSILQNYFLEQFRRPTQRVKIPCGTKKPERIKLPKPAKIDRFEILYDLPKMKKFRDTRFDDPKPFSWEELKEEAKKMGYIYVDNDTGTYLFNPDKSVSFCRNGCFVADSGMIGGDVYISSNRSYDQMLAIMKALQ